MEMVKFLSLFALNFVIASLFYQFSVELPRVADVMHVKILNDNKVLSAVENMELIFLAMLILQ